MDGKTINRRIRVGRIGYFGHVIRREKNHPLKLAYNLKHDKKKEGRPSLTWIKSLEQDFQKYQSMNRSSFEELSKDREKMKRKLEEIYKNEGSEISDGESSEEENREKRYKHWKRKRRNET